MWWLHLHQSELHPINTCDNCSSWLTCLKIIWRHNEADCTHCGCVKVLLESAEHWQLKENILLHSVLDAWCMEWNMFHVSVQLSAWTSSQALLHYNCLVSLFWPIPNRAMWWLLIHNIPRLLIWGPLSRKQCVHWFMSIHLKQHVC